MLPNLTVIIEVAMIAVKAVEPDSIKLAYQVITYITCKSRVLTSKSRVHTYTVLLKVLRDGTFDIRGGWDFFEKNSLFPNWSEKK